MRKIPSGRFHKQDEIFKLSSKDEISLESGFTRNDFQQINTELNDIHDRLKIVLGKLINADAPEYFRLAKIVDVSIEELIIRTKERAEIEFPDKSEIAGKTVQVDDVNDSEITWKELCRLEPGLVDLWSEAKEVEDNNRRKSFCKYDYFGEHFVDRLMELLGSWVDNQNPKLKSMKSLDLAKDIILDELPPCRNCKNHDKKPPDADSSDSK
jgi:hypothetical protein